MRIITNKANMDIRRRINASSIPQYEIARRCGVGEGTLCRWLRYELAADDERRILILSVLDGGSEDEHSAN